MQLQTLPYLDLSDLIMKARLHEGLARTLSESTSSD